MKMEMRDIEYFAVVAGQGNVGRAAEQLGLSQPALSKSLRRLEAAVGAKLVKRTPKGVDLTAVGTALFARARGLRLSLDDIEREAVELGQGRAGHLRIGAGSVLAFHLLPAACGDLRKDAANLSISLVTGEPNILNAGIRNGELDLVVTSIQESQHSGLIEEHLFDEEYVVYASVNHPLAKRRQLTLADLAHEQWVMAAANSPSERRLSQVFAGAGLPPPKIAVDATDWPSRHQFVATSELLGFGSRTMMRFAATRFRLTPLPVKDIAVKRRVGIVYRKNAYLPPAALRLIDILKITAKEIVREKR